MKRSVAKAITYRILSATVTALLLSAAIEVKLAMALVGLDAIVKLCVYVVHEEVWARFRGRL